MIIGIDPSFRACGVSDGTRHAIIETKPRADEEALPALRRRSREISDGVLRFIGESEVVRMKLTGAADLWIFIEGPALRAATNAGNHLYDLGWLMHDLVTTLELEYVRTPVIVPTLAVKRFASGKATCKKDEMKLAVFKKWRVEFDRDPGCDKLHAFVLHKIGEAALRGEEVIAPIRRRGEGQRKKKAVA